MELRESLYFQTEYCLLLLCVNTSSEAVVFDIFNISGGVCDRILKFEK